MRGKPWKKREIKEKEKEKKKKKIIGVTSNFYFSRGVRKLTRTPTLN
jgi:hypothetical protein